VKKFPDALERGRRAYAQQAWDDAYLALSEADQAAPLDADALERMAWSAGLSGRVDAFLSTHERLHQLRLGSGDSVGAARAAFWVGFRLMGLGEIARGSGWLARAERVIEGADRECAERGYLMLPLAIRQLGSGELDLACATAASAAAIGDRLGDRDLAAFARTIQGRARVRQSRGAGLALLDEVMIAVTSGELSPMFTGIIYCTVIDVCRSVYAIDRAGEWTAALASWCDAQPQLVAFSGHCLVHRAEIMQLHGEWPEAIAEAQRATARVQRTQEQEGLAEAFYQQGEIRRLRGEDAAAEEAYRAASQHGREPQPGLALLRLAQGQNDAAAGAIRQVAGATRDALQRARFLPASVEILLAVGDLEEARRGADELEQIAATFDSEVLAAMAAHARGAVALADGDAAGALAPLRRAFAVWQQVGAPYLAARLRVLIGRACETLGDLDGASLEREAARAVFAGLGAAPDLARLDAAASSPPAGDDHGLTARELEVLRLVATGKTNKAIAQQLFLSEKTVDRHVSNIFNKLDVSSRAAATAFAYQHELI